MRFAACDCRLSERYPRCVALRLPFRALTFIRWPAGNAAAVPGLLCVGSRAWLIVSGGRPLEALSGTESQLYCLGSEAPWRF
eukprot:9467295-Pyramimonas_sp.AAC.1